MGTSHARLTIVAADQPGQEDDYVAPYMLPQECEHPTLGRCWLCCPCGECGEARRRYEAEVAPPPPPTCPAGRPTLTIVG